MAKKEADKDWLPSLVEWVEDSETTSSEERELSERDRDYYDGKQLTAEEKEALQKRGQPPLVFNRVRRKVDFLQGLEKQSRSDPKAFPRTPNDEQAAEAATDAIRFVCDLANFPAIASEVWEAMLIEGAGGSIMTTRQGKDRVEIELDFIPYDRLIWDPHSRKADFTDAKFLGGILWMDEDDVLAQWPDAADAIETAYAADNGFGQIYEDRPEHRIWGDAQRKRVRVATMAWKDGGRWMLGTFTRGGFLDAPVESPFLDEDGEPACPYVFQSAYVDRDNQRYGVVRDMIGPQDAINKRESKALHLLSVRQVVADQGAVQDVDHARRELAKPDGYIEKTPGMDFEIQQTADLASGQAALLQDAKMELDLMGPNAAMAGKDNKDQSGRAIALQQQGGQIEAGTLQELHRQWKKRVYRQIWNAIRQFWTTETWVRVTDNEQNVKFVGLNRQVTLADELMEMPEEQAMQMVQQMGIQAGDPRLTQVVRTENAINELDVDIVLDEAADVVTLQSETFAMITDMVRAGLPIPPDAVIEASPLRSEVKKKMLERMSGVGPDGQPAPPPPELVQAQAKMEHDKARLALDTQKHMDDVRLREFELGIQANAPQGDVAPPAPPPPDPVAVARLELDRQKADADIALRRDELQLKAALEGAKLQQSAQAAQTKATERAAPNVGVMMRPEVEDRIASGTAESARAISDAATSMQQVAMTMADAVQQLSRAMSAPKRVVRGPDGRAVGVETVGAA